jgi:DNA-binding NtrC family response regulator
MASFNILLIDDEKPFVETLAKRLKKRGYQVSVAFSGHEGLAMIEQDESLDAAVVDVKMPGMDGIETVRKIKETRPLLEVVMLTGHATVASSVQSMRLGACDYLMKPYDLEDLVVKLNKAAKRKRDRETRLLEIRMKPYISQSEKDELIQKLLES